MGEVKRSNNTGLARRADLNLRAEYPEFKTTIYRIQENDFSIYIENAKKNFEEISKKFKEEIKPVVAPIKLTNSKPKKYLEILPSMTDKEISSGLEGILMNKTDWMNFLVAKFPKINFYKISDNHGVVNIHIANYKIKEGLVTKLVFLDAFSKKDLENFIENHNSSLKFNIVVDEFQEKPELTPGFDSDSRTLIFIKDLKSKPFFVQRDESLWFDNVDHIFQGNFKKDNLFFFNKKEYSCYVDFSVFPNIDLRYYLMLYEVCYIAPPLEKPIKEWLKVFGVTTAEFIELIVRKRIRIILPQDVSRYDVNFFKEVYDLAPEAIISKRAISCLQQCDIVELSDNYIFNDLNCINEFRNLSNLVFKKNNVNEDLLYNMMVWPIKARRKSFEFLHRGGVLSTSLYGVNKIISNPTGNSTNESVDFLMSMYSPSIHIAHSLNATYFPFQSDNNHSDEKYADMMGKLLNFCQSATYENFNAFQKDESHLLKGNSFISPIDIISINTYDSILEFEEVLSKEIIYPNSQRLLETLSSLCPDEQVKKMNYYNKELKKYLKQKDRYYKTFDFSVQSLNAFLGLSTGVPTGPILTGLKLASKGAFGRFSPIKNIVEKIEQVAKYDIDKKNIHFLSRINRVAKLKNKNF